MTRPLRTVIWLRYKLNVGDSSFVIRPVCDVITTVVDRIVSDQRAFHRVFRFGLCIEDPVMPRLFTGLEIPSDIGLTLSSLRGGLPGARWIDPENYHVTLRFIGDIDGIIANEIASTLFRVNRKPFEVALQGLSSFGGKKPRAVVASVVPSRPLMELQAELERLMQRMGLDPEGRKFIPHVTLARLRDASNQDVADYLSVRGYFPTKVFTASRFVLFSSRSSVGGGPYVVEDSYALSP